MSLYQSETLVRMEYLKETLKELGDRKLVARRAEELPNPDIPEDYPIGFDWHTRLGDGESLSAEIAGELAL